MREIWGNKGISRIELARRLELDKSTVTLLVNKMLKQGVLETLSEGTSGPRGGRKPQALGINAHYAYFLGFEVLPQGIRIALVDLQGRLIEKEYIQLSSRNHSVEKDVIPEIVRHYERFGRGYNIMGIGLALSGVIDPFEGQILQSMLLNVSEPLELVEMAQYHFPCTLMIENDANCCAWGELVQNRDSELSDFLYILIESSLLRENGDSDERISLGMGIVFDGKVFHGKQFSSGEFKSIFWQDHQAETSQFSYSKEDLMTLKSNKDLRIGLFREISKNIAFLTNTLNLNHIYIGGDIRPYWNEFSPILEEEIQLNWSYPDQVRCQCNLSSQDEYAAAYGAAAMHLERVFASYQATFYQEKAQKIGLEALNIE